MSAIESSGSVGGPSAGPESGSIGGTSADGAEPSGGGRLAGLGPTFGAGVVTALVGFSSSFAVVIAGLRAVGATERQAASGLLVVCVLMGATAIVFSVRHRMPISIAWSTPGAALLVSVGAGRAHSGHGGATGYREAVGAFLVTGLLIAVTGLSRTLTRWIAAIPAPISAAMLAGVIAPICLESAQAAVHLPRLALPAIAVWVLLGRLAKRWAVPAALATAFIGLALDPTTRGHLTGGLLPTLTTAAPHFDPGTLISLAVPLYLVTMASQNLAGIAVMRSYGYEPPIREVLIGTGTASTLAAPLGGIPINFAAITAALAASPDSHHDPRRRWIAATTAGALYIALGLSAAMATTLLIAAPPLLIEGVAGLALLPALGASLTTALSDTRHREAATAAFVTTASGITIAGIGAPFWGLLTGLTLLALSTSTIRPPKKSEP
ncbi:benzoate/H(+) symporter BenE family transporter [Catenulispora yoronensis]|uniref:Benzoate/H(+) symporter BenE family transporter n=1 Tax=Catenulispora yoronensis TaxID=450799 RepID=A0ABP5F6R3_9ACTN